MRLFHLVNSLVGYEQMRKPNHGIVPIIPSSLLCSSNFASRLRQLNLRSSSRCTRTHRLRTNLIAVLSLTQMAGHQWRVDVPLRSAPGHGAPLGRSQADSRPGDDVSLCSSSTGKTAKKHCLIFRGTGLRSP
uniref:Uncharacterized protein n=1 Tax=Hyaloperonospora arabidopsidis (strain Emoy2) TaxID=559515 RepID=M4B2V6_HYAAE